jgi:ABC-2 type transport system permease protein
MLLNKVFLNLIAFIGMIGILGTSSILITSSLYNKGLRSQLENKALLKNKGHIENMKTHYDAVVKKDFKSIIRETGMAFNAFMGPLLTPLLIIFIASNLFKGTQNEQGFMNGKELFFGISFIFYYSILILCSTNYSSIIAFSREGEQFIISKYLPMDYKVLARGKAKLANIISLVGVSLTSISSFVALALSGIEINLLSIVNVIILGINLLIFSIGFNYLGIYRDLKKPKINWQSTNEVVKKNGNAMISMFLCMGMGLGVLLYSVLLLGLKVSPIVLWPLFWSVTIISSVILLLIFKNKLENSCAELIENFEA